MFHNGNLEKTVFTLDFHEFWTYLITALFFIIIYVFSHFIVVKQGKADQKIIEAERNYIRLLEGATNLFSAITDGISIIDNDFNLIQINPTIEKWYSFKNQIIGKKCYEIYCNRNTPCINCLNLENLDKSKSASIIIPKLNKEGNQCGWLESSLYPLIEKASSEKVGAIYYIRDITDRKIIEEKLKESEKKYRLLIENAHEGIWALDKAANTTFVNSRMSELLGYSIDEMLGKHLFYFMDEEGKKKAEYQLERRKKGIQERHEFEFLQKDRSRIFTSLDTSPIIDDTGNIIGAVAFVTDITQRKEAEQKLKESEEKFRNIAENSLIGIIIWQDGLIKYANEAAAKLFEYPMEELIKWSNDDLDKNIYPDDLPILLKYANKNSSKHLDKNTHISYRIKTSSKTLKWVDQYLSRIIFQGYDAALLTLVDITEKREAENLIVQENLKLIELNKLRKELITRVSHEFKTPLNLVYGALQMLNKYKNEINSEALRYIEIIEKGGERLNKIIEDLIDCSKIESQDLFIRRKTENLVEIVKERVEELIYFANERGILLNIEIPKDLYLNIDKFRIEQVITNLLSNAIKNTPARGIINIILYDSDKYVDLSIQDTGIGLTEKDKQKLFKKFGKIERQGKSLGINTEGSGLGLYLSNEIIKLHGGQILINSEGRNKGATFTIRLLKNQLK